jgi:repressor LexA
MSLGQNIRLYREKLGLSQEELAKKLGYKDRSTIAKIENNVNDLTQSKIVAIADALQTTPAALMGWESEISSLPENIIPMPEMRKVPLIGAIACGAPILADEHIEDYVDIPRHVHADFALTCKGDSMINARIFDGDIVYIRQQDTAENGDIAAVLIDGEATLKRVRLFDDHISLEPENPMYKPLVFWHEEMNTVRILGKAVAFTSAVR